MQIRMVIKTYCLKFVPILFMGIIWPNCSQGSQSDHKLERDLLLMNLYGLWVSTYGDCIHSHKFGSNAGLLHCSRTPQLLCSTTGKLDETGRLIVEATRQKRYQIDWAAIIDQHPDCQLSMATLLQSKSFKTTVDADKPTIESNNVLMSTNNCELAGFETRDKLIDDADHKYYTSAKAQLALQALRLTQTACYNSLALNEYEKNLIESLKDGSKVASTSCRYGSQANLLLPIYSDCSASEKTYATPFDFSAF